MSWEPVRGPRPTPPLGEFFLTKAGEMEVVLWGTWAHTNTHRQKVNIVFNPLESSKLASRMFFDYYIINKAVWWYGKTSSKKETVGSYGLNTLLMSHVDGLQVHFSWLTMPTKSNQNKASVLKVTHFTSCFYFLVKVKVNSLSQAAFFKQKLIQPCKTVQFAVVV